MAQKKVYAVKKGKQTGLFYSWEECREAVEGYPGAKYQGFATQEEARTYLNIQAEAQKDTGTRTKAGKRKKTEMKMEAPAAGGAAGEDSAAAKRKRPDVRPASPENLIAYVDGSYDHSLKKYAFGCVFLLADGSMYTECGNGDNPESLALRNVTGEMLGAMFAVRFAVVNGFRRVELRYDYQGIEKWVTGEWRSKTELTRKYAEAMRRWAGSVELVFTKVTAHTNVYYNEVADRTAKRGLTEANGVPQVRRIEEMTPEEARAGGE